MSRTSPAASFPASTPPRGALAAVGGLAVFLLVGFLSSSVSAELMIERVHWQLAVPVRGQKPAYQEISSLSTVPPKFVGKLRACVVLKNRGPHAVEGILLRYSLTARLAALDKTKEGVWAVPYMVDEKRVPRVGANQILEVPLDPSRSVDLPLHLYLQRVYRAGFWPDQFKIQVMLSPHRGAVEDVKTQEGILQIRK